MNRHLIAFVDRLRGRPNACGGEPEMWNRGTWDPFVVPTHVGVNRVVWRWLADGTPDLTLGGVGYVGDSQPLGVPGNSNPGGVAVDSMGRIIVAGNATNSGDGRDVVVWRFLENGAPDAAFGTAGRAVDEGLHGQWEDGESGGVLSLDPWDRIVVAGSMGDALGYRPAVWRFLP